MSVIFYMNNKTKSYFTALFLAIGIYSLTKITVNHFNKPKSNTPIVIDQKEKVTEAIVPKQTSKPIKKQKITKNGLNSGGNWRSK